MYYECNVSRETLLIIYLIYAKKQPFFTKNYFLNHNLPQKNYLYHKTIKSEQFIKIKIQFKINYHFCLNLKIYLKKYYPPKNSLCYIYTLSQNADINKNTFFIFLPPKKKVDREIIS